MPSLSPTPSEEREKLRRAAAGGDQGPTEEEQAGGAWPLDVVRRLAGDPQDPTNVSFPFLRRMRRDHMIAFCLHLIEMGCLKAPWYFSCTDARAAAFADNLIRPIYGRLVRTILRYLWSGYSPGVKRFKFVRPDWVYYVYGEPDAKKVWAASADAAIFRPVLPLKPELCRPDWDASGNFNGIRYDGRYAGSGIGGFVVDGFESKKIDLVHSFWATHGEESEDGSAFGVSRISHCAPIFWEYWRMWATIGRAFENNGDPGPLVRYPQNDETLKDEDGNLIVPVKTALTIGRRRRSGSTVAIPSDTYASFDDRPSTAKKWDIEYPAHETNFAAMMEWMGYLEAQKCTGLWASEQGVAGGSVTGSSSNRNVFEGAGDLRDESLTVLMAMIDEFIDNVFVRPAFAMNMPEFKGTIQKKTLGINKDDEDAIRQLFQLVGQEDWRNFGADVGKLAEARGFPMLDPAARERQMREIASKVEGGAPPVVTPDQGRRAMVTQTGFGETAYVQLESYGDGVVLADDGDFVASLPKSDHFSDKAVVGSTRRLRRQARSYYQGLYEDFAIYVSRSKTLDLAEGDDSWAKKLVDTWRPRVDRTRTFIERVRAVFSLVFDRQSALTAKDLSSKNRVTSTTSRRAAQWIEEHGAELVEGITDTVRDELNTFLAREVERGSSPKEAAKAIRQEFSTWPDTKADLVAVTEIPRAVNFAVLAANEAAGVKKVQLVDGDGDKPCADRNGRVLSIEQAYKQDLLHPRCTLWMRGLPKSDELSVVRHALEDGLLARFDENTQTVLLSPELDEEGERDFMLALGSTLASVSSSTNGYHPEVAATIDE